MAGSAEAASPAAAVATAGAPGLPGELLQHVARFCALPDAARFHAVCKGWRDGLAAPASPFYPELCRRHFAPLLCDPSLPPYHGSWRRLFLSMVAITRPVYEILNEGAEALETLAQGIDAGEACEAAVANEKEKGAIPATEQEELGPDAPGVRQLFEDFMQATFRLGLKVHLRKLSQSPALEAYLVATGRLLERHPLVQRCLDAFVSKTDALAMHYDVWNGGFVEFPNVPWRRSAIAFFSDLYIHRAHQQPKEVVTTALPPPPPPGGGEGVRRLVLGARPGNAAGIKFAPGAVTALDVTIGSTLEEAMELFVPPVPGVPSSHWWWFPGGRMGYAFHVC